MVAFKEEKAIGKEPTDEMKRGKVQIAKYGLGGLFGCRAYELRENIYLNTQNASGVFALGWAWFAWAAQELSVHRMGACCDIKKFKSTHINPALASHTEPKADIGLSV